MKICLFGFLMLFGLRAVSPAEQNWVGMETGDTFGIKNPNYVIQFSKQDGHIVSISAGTTQTPICTGEGNEWLWSLGLSSHLPDITTTENQSNEERKQRKNSTSVDIFLHPKSNGITQFLYRWSDDSEELDLSYYSHGTTLVTMHVIPSEKNYIDMVGEVYNGFPAVAVTFNFPQNIMFDTYNLRRFIFPNGLGVAFNSNFYKSHHRTLWNYPNLFSDFVSIESDAGTLAIYAIQKVNQFTPANLTTLGMNTTGVYHHNFATYIYPYTTWSSPTMRFQIGLDTRLALEDYAHVHRFDRTLSLEQKLGDPLFSKVAQDLMVKIHIPGSFQTVTQGLSELPRNTLLHPVAYWRGGFDHNYPDFLPPDEKLGGVVGFSKMITTAQKMGMLVMPYINPTWWNESESLNLLHRENISVYNLDGTLRWEEYFKNGGYAVTPTHDGVRRTIVQLINRLKNDYGIDLLFEDQIGARSWLYDRNPRALSPTGYTQGLIDMARMHSQSLPIFTERGFDQLIPWESGFCGLPTESYPEFDDYNAQWGKGNWTIYPLALYLAHDKVGFYQHDLSVPTMTRYLKQLSWNLVYGYGLSINMTEHPSKEEIAWWNLLGRIQKEVCAKYMGKKLTDYQQFPNGVVKSTFEDYSILGNFSGGEFTAIPTGDSKIQVAKDGFLVVDSQNNNVAGVFTQYNNQRFDQPTLLLFDMTKSNRMLFQYTFPENRLQESKI